MSPPDDGGPRRTGSRHEPDASPNANPAPVYDADDAEPPTFAADVLHAWRDQCHRALLHDDDAAPARAWLKGQGVPLDLVRDYKLGWASSHPDDRLHAMGRRLVVVDPSWGAMGRAVPGMTPASMWRCTWRNTRGGGRAWRIHDVDPALPVIVVCDPFDVLGIHRMAGPQGLALGGRTLKSEDARELHQRGVRRAYVSLERRALQRDWEQVTGTLRAADIEPVLLRGPQGTDWRDTMTVDDATYFARASVALSNVLNGSP